MTRHLSAVTDTPPAPRRPTAPPWVRVVGGAIGLGIIALAESILALGIIAVWRTILGA